MNSRSHKVACFWRKVPGQRVDKAEWTGGRLEHMRTVEFPVLEAGRNGFGRLERTLKRSLNHQTGIEQYALPCAWCPLLPWDFPWCYTVLSIRITTQILFHYSSAMITVLSTYWIISVCHDFNGSCLRIGHAICFLFLRVSASAPWI